VAVAKATLHPGDTIDGNKVSFEVRDLTATFGSGYYLDAEKLNGLRAGMRISPGTVLRAANTIQPRTISQGEMVDLVAEQGDLSIRTQVKALEDGQLSQWIHVQNPSSLKILVARVIAPGEVQLK
jgi:flagella basal body P-ring formation protein FlgA